MARVAETDKPPPSRRVLAHAAHCQVQSADGASAAGKGQAVRAQRGLPREAEVAARRRDSVQRRLVADQAVAALANNADEVLASG